MNKYLEKVAEMIKVVEENKTVKPENKIQTGMTNKDKQIKDNNLP